MGWVWGQERQSSHDLIILQRSQPPNIISVMVCDFNMNFEGNPKIQTISPRSKNKVVFKSFFSTPLSGYQYFFFFIKYCLVSFIIFFICSKIFKASPLNEFLSHWSLHLHLIFSFLSADPYYELFASIKYIHVTGVSLWHWCPSHHK